MNTAVFLYVLVAGSAGTGSSTYHWSRTPQPDWVTCKNNVAAAKLANSNGAENETAVAMYCGGRDAERHYSSTWWMDKAKETP